MSDNKKKPTVRPRLIKVISHALRDEWLALEALFKFQWPLIAVCVLGLVLLLWAVKPLPPSRLKLAVGQPQSSLDAWGKQYAAYFKSHGIALELIPTSGTSENIELIKQGKVDAAFSIGGTFASSDLPNIVSLGSIEYQPLWLFYRGADLGSANPSDFFADKTFSINIPGSGTRQTSEKILALHGVATQNNPRMLSLATGESVDALIAGKLDGVFIVAGIEAQGVQRMAAEKDLRIYDFPFARAYGERLKNLDAVMLPRGSFDVMRDIPNRDTHMAAANTTILTRADLHPALAFLFLKGAQKIDHERLTFFERPGGFPARSEPGVLMHAEAQRFYDKGDPLLFSHLPFWLANFVDRIWFALFAAFAIIYPLFKILPAYRSRYAELCMKNYLDDMAQFEAEFIRSSLQDWPAQVARFKALEHEATQLWIPSGDHRAWFSLKDVIDQVRRRMGEYKNQLDTRASQAKKRNQSTS